jgi:uncharacterized protein (DUF488 family)
MMASSTIYTGHSTRMQEEFIALLQQNQIAVLADIRTHPGSRRYPHFNQQQLSEALQEHGIRYIHIPELGGRRKPVENSVNNAWRHPSFRGYADHMQTNAFVHGIGQLMEIAKHQRVAYMCSEAPWWKCHRALVSDYLKAKGWKVLHILTATSIEEHPYTSPAHVRQGNLFYSE